MPKRLSISLESDDEALIARFAEAGSSEQDTLRAWAQQRGFRTTDSLSEGALIRLLARAGAEALREHVLDLAYAQLAVEVDTEHLAETRALRERDARRRAGARAR